MKKSRYPKIFVVFLVSFFALIGCCKSRAVEPEKEYFIIFESNGGSEVASIKTKGNAKINLPDDPIKDEYHFQGWFFDNNTFENQLDENSFLNKAVTANVTVYAKWIETATMGIEYEDNVTYYSVSGYSGTGPVVRIPSTHNDLPVNKIKEYAFKDKTNITKILVPNEAVEIGYAAFSGCDNITTLTLPFVGEKRGDTGTENSLFGHIFGKVALGEEGGTPQYYSTSGIPVVFDIPASIKTITITDETILSHGAFGALKNVKYIQLNQSLQTIEANAFYMNEGLEVVNIPYEITSIPYRAFFKTKNLQSIDIDFGITSIGEEAFFGSSAITMLELPSTLVSIGENAFSQMLALESITVDENNEYFASVDGVLFNKEKTELLVYPINKLVTAYELPNTVTTIPSYAFMGCTNLISITIPASVTNINLYAFSYISSLEAIIVNEHNNDYSSVDGVLFNKEGTELINFPSSKNATNYEVSSDVTDILSYAFEGCNNLTSVIIPASVTGVGDYAFVNCENLTIYAEVAEMPTYGWGEFWNNDNLPVVWGYTG